MDYKSKLKDLVANEKSLADAKQAQQDAFYASLRLAFAPMASTLREIAEAVEPDIASFSIDSFSARIKVGMTTYEVEPDRSISFHEPSQLKPGFKITTLTRYKYGEVDSLERDYVLETSEAVVDEVMKLLAKAIASNTRK